VNPLGWLAATWRKLFPAGRPSNSSSLPLPSAPNSSAVPKAPSGGPTSGAEPSQVAAAKKRKFSERLLNTPNVSDRRITPQAVVMHHTAGKYAGSVSWCMNPASKVSYHCIVAMDGRRTVLADPDERTWHAGVSKWRGRGDLNSWSIGAAFEGDTNTRELGNEEMESMAEYLVPIMREYGLGLADVTDHRTVSPGRKDDLRPQELARFKSFLARRL